MINKGTALLETVTAAAIAGIVTLSLAAGLTTALQVASTAHAVTRGRLLAQAHLELALANQGPEELAAAGLVSRLEVHRSEAGTIYVVEVTGGSLLRPLRLAGLP